MESNWVCNHTSDNKIGFTIMGVITDRIGRHEVLLSINHKNYREKKNSQIVKRTEIKPQKTDNNQYVIDCN